MRTALTALCLLLATMPCGMALEQTFELVLSTGWNLVSLPIDPGGRAVDAVFEGRIHGDSWTCPLLGALAWYRGNTTDYTSPMGVPGPRVGGLKTPDRWGLCTTIRQKFVFLTRFC